MKQKFKIILRLLRNKYVLTIVIFFVWMLFFDQNSLVDRVSLFKGIKEMKNERERLINEINNTRENIYELQSSSENLEKFAREEYLMKKPHEDIFIIISE